MGRTTTRAISRLLVVGMVAATTLVAFTGTSWASDRTHAAEELSFITKINAERSQRDLPGLAISVQLTGVARRWSDRMASDRRISHNPKLADQVEGDWTRLGENVGFSSRSATSPAEFVERLHKAFMDSPGHRANVLGEYNQVGVGVRMTGNTMWVTVNFSKARTVLSNRSVGGAAKVARREFVASGGSGQRASYVVLTATDQRAHALGAAALAGDKGPLLYTHPADSWDESPVLHPSTRAQIDRLLGGGGVVYVIGGRKDVSATAVRELTNDGYTVKRLNAKGKAATLVRVAKETIRRHGDSDRVLIGRAGDWKSSVAASAWGAETGTPFLVTGRKRLHPSVRDYLRTHRPDKRWVVGSTRSISKRVKVAAGAKRMGPNSRAAAYAPAPRVAVSYLVRS
jgi:uncharacterized protein YkwD